MRELQDTTDLDEMQNKVFTFLKEKGWLRDPNGPEAWKHPPVPTFTEACMLVTTELGEAVDAWRSHGLEGPMFEYGRLRPEYRSSPRNEEGTPGKPVHAASEIADAFIRLLDLCHRFDIDLVAEFHRKMEYNDTRPHRHGGKKL